MARWVELTNVQGQKFHVNLERAIVLTDNANGKGAKITFSLQDPKPLKVKENTDEIKKLLRAK